MSNSKTLRFILDLGISLHVTIFCKYKQNKQQQIVMGFLTFPRKNSFSYGKSTVLFFEGAAQLIPGVDVQGKRLVDSHSSCDCLLDLQNTLCKLVEKVIVFLAFIYNSRAE